MIFLRIFEEIYNFHNLSLALMESSYVIEGNIHVFNNFKLLLLGSHLCSSSHILPSCRDDGLEDEQDENSVHDVVDPVDPVLEAGQSDIFVLYVPVCDNDGHNFIEGEDGAVKLFSVDFACHLFVGDLFVPEIFLFDELYFLEGVHLKQLHKSLRFEFFLVADVFEDQIGHEHSNECFRHLEFRVVDTT